MRAVTRRIAVVLLAAGCASCTTLGRVPASASLGSNGDTYFVIGISPAKTRVTIKDGHVSGGSFEQSGSAAVMPFSATLMDVPQDGFVVGKAPAGTTLSLYRVFDETAWPDVVFGPCKTGAKMLVFTVPSSSVVYITSVSFRRIAGGLDPAYADDIEAARTFLKARYPNLAEKLQRGTYKLLTAR
jgi:hypothetical protein